MTTIDDQFAAPFEVRPAFKAAPFLPNGSRPVVSTDQGVTAIVCFTTSNPDVARLVDQADDPVVCVERMLGIGAAAMLSAGLQLDTAVVERRFDDLNVGFDASMKGAFESIGGLLDEDGTIACALEDVKHEIAAVINSTFDPANTKSVVARLNELVDKAQVKMVAEMQRQLTPDVEPDKLVFQTMDDMAIVACEDGDTAGRPARSGEGPLDFPPPLGSPSAGLDMGGRAGGAQQGSEVLCVAGEDDVVVVGEEGEMGVDHVAGAGGGAELADCSGYVGVETVFGEAEEQPGEERLA
jgi:hypothetical protein